MDNCYDLVICFATTYCNWYNRYLFLKKSGMTTPDENVQGEQRGQVMKQNGVNNSGSGT